MPDYRAPGVYVEEVPSSVKAIAGASTSTGGFIGIVSNTIHLVTKNPDNPEEVMFEEFQPTAEVGKPVLISSWTQFTKIFGDLTGNPEGTLVPVTSPGPAVDEGHRQLAHAVYGFFNNGGSTCYVARVTDLTEVAGVLTEFEAIDDIAIVAAPGIGIGDSNPDDSFIRGQLDTHCKLTEDRFAIFDGPESVTSLADLRAGLAPDRTDTAAWYFPWVRVFDPATKLLYPDSDGSITVAPSGHITGIYARVDGQRGVHKAPANEVIRGALDVTQYVSKGEQKDLNDAGVNCIRVLNKNILVWGARTVGGNANADLKYINVRRTLLFLRESIDEGTQWIVFEPNTQALWQKIARNITAFLTVVWRSGALFGTTPQEAFYVKCDAETNPPELRELGQVVTEIGVAIVRPAEFVVFRISQMAQSA